MAQQPPPALRANNAQHQWAGNAGLYLAEGDCLNAAISAAAIVPVVGSAAVAARSADRARDGARAASNISDAARGANHADEVADAARAGTRYGDEVATATGRQADEITGAACSFSEETLVATDSGFVPIGELDVGEMVLAWDQSLDSTDFYTVTAVWAHLDSTVVILTIDGEEIETTPEHPFYIANNAWVAAGELWLGARVKKADAGYGTVEAISVVDSPQMMYNLTVEGAHTFFVGQDRWLVHNHCAQASDELVELARTHAQEISRNASTRRRRTNTTAVLRTSDGQVFGGRSGHGNPPAQAIREIMETHRNNFGCAEIDCINQAINSGVDLQGASITPVKVRGSLDDPTLSFIKPCSPGGCEDLLSGLGITFVPFP